MKRLIVLLGVAGVSLSAILVRWSTAPSLILVLYRVGMAALLLAPAVLFRYREEWKGLTYREALLCIASGAFLGLHFTAYFAALDLTSIASAVVLVDTEVLFVALATVLVLGRKLSRQAWIAVLLAFGGSMLVAAGDISVSAKALWGDMIALAGALCMAVYTMIGTVCRRRLTTTVYTFLVYAAAAVTVLVIALVQGMPLTGYGPINYATAFGMAVFCTLLGHSVFSWGLKYLPPAFIATVKLLEPVFAALWGLALFAEVPGWTVILGGAVVIGGVALYSHAADDET